MLGAVGFRRVRDEARSPKGPVPAGPIRWGVDHTRQVAAIVGEFPKLPQWGGFGLCNLAEIAPRPSRPRERNCHVRYRWKKSRHLGLTGPRIGRCGRPTSPTRTFVTRLSLFSSCAHHRTARRARVDITASNRPPHPTQPRETGRCFGSLGLVIVPRHLMGFRRGRVGNRLEGSFGDGGERAPHLEIAVTPALTGRSYDT